MDDVLAGLRVRIANALRDSVRQSVELSHPFGTVAIAFSGGLDSSIIAWIAKDFAKYVKLYAVGVLNCQDFKTAQHSAESLGMAECLKLVTIPTDLDAVRTLAARVRKILGMPADYFGMDLELALPLLVISEELQKHGDGSCLLSGQGADELFAGYAKYARLVDDTDANPEQLARALSSDWERLVKERIPKDRTACMSAGIVLRTPFTDARVACLAKSMPASFLLPNGGCLRKHILRCIGRELGLPAAVTRIPKKAFQYGSGTCKLLRKLRDIEKT